MGEESLEIVGEIQEKLGFYGPFHDHVVLAGYNLFITTLNKTVKTSFQWFYNFDSKNCYSVEKIQSSEKFS